MNNTSWKKEELNFIQKFYSSMSNQSFYKKFNNIFSTKRSLYAIKAKARQMKVYVSKQTNIQSKFVVMANKYPIGHIKDTGAILYIKIKNNQSRKISDNYMPLSQYTLEKNGIQITKDQCIKHKDGNYKNCDLNNLLVISKYTFAYMNRNNLWNKGKITETALKVGELLDEIRKQENRSE